MKRCPARGHLSAAREKARSYMIPGDEYHPFDPNAFVERLVKDTGIAHVWEPVRTRVAEGGRCIITSSFGVQGQVEIWNARPRRKPVNLVGDLELGLPARRVARSRGCRGEHALES